MSIIYYTIFNSAKKVLVRILFADHELFDIVANEMKQLTL